MPLPFVDFLKGDRMKDIKQTIDIPLHDIKPLLEIEEYSFYYLLALIALISTVVIGLLYLLVKYLQYRNKFNIRKEHLKSLHEIDFSDAKKAAYNITTYGYTFKEDGERQRSAYDSLVEHLEAYKYKKNVENFDEETKHSLDRYIGMIDV